MNNGNAELAARTRPLSNAYSSPPSKGTDSLYDAADDAAASPSRRAAPGLSANRRGATRTGTCAGVAAQIRGGCQLGRSVLTSWCGTLRARSRTTRRGASGSRLTATGSPSPALRRGGDASAVLQAVAKRAGASGGSKRQRTFPLRRTLGTRARQPWPACPLAPPAPARAACGRRSARRCALHPAQSIAASGDDVSATQRRAHAAASCARCALQAATHRAGQRQRRPVHVAAALRRRRPRPKRRAAVLRRAGKRSRALRHLQPHAAVQRSARVGHTHGGRRRACGRHAPTVASRAWGPSPGCHLAGTARGGWRTRLTRPRLPGACTPAPRRACPCGRCRRWRRKRSVQRRTTAPAPPRPAAPQRLIPRPPALPPQPRSLRAGRYSPAWSRQHR